MWPASCKAKVSNHPDHVRFFTERWQGGKEEGMGERGWGEGEKKKEESVNRGNGESENKTAPRF
jgi:hypothetical protein